MLHVLGTGILKYLFESVSDLIGPNDSKKKEKDMLDALFSGLVQDAARQSDCDFPRMSMRGGVTDPVKLTGSERIGNLNLFLCLSYTGSGVALLRPGWEQNNISQRDSRECMKLLLGFYCWVNMTNSIQQVEDAHNLLKRLIELIQHCFPRDSGNGWNIPKIHSLSKMIFYMLKFGCVRNFSGQVGERALQRIVKNHAQVTQRRAVNFAEQIATRRYETQVLEYAFEDIKPELGLDYELVENTDI